MRNEQNAVLTTLRRVQKFLDTNATLLSDVNTSTRKQLDDVVTELVSASLAQETGSRSSQGETARNRVSVLALRRHYMAPVAELAKLKLTAVPEFAALRLPPANAAALRTVNAANAMADAATPYASTLVAAGLPATFADDLRKAAASVLESLDGRGGHLNQRMNATATLVAAERNGRSLLRVLNALVMARIEGDAGVVAEWNGSKLVRRKPGPVLAQPADTAQPSNAATPTGPTLVTSPAPSPIAATPLVPPAPATAATTVAA
jgi:hypothetical protein